MRCVRVCVCVYESKHRIFKRNEVPFELGVCYEISKSEFTPIIKNHSENVADLNH